ncbi:MAG: DegT/DnrJ/EryC1/StrS family aminotransferase [Lentisphaeria bacterium]|nr:DegT/DnrJ/EryC1/StrS family aminotransferase [Lentisphaeria bacterium]
MKDKSHLAINGGSPAVKSLPDRYFFGKEERDAVTGLIDKLAANGGRPGYNGPEEEAFCKEFSEFMGGGYADGVNSGTNSIFVALKALHLPPFSEVVTGCVSDAGGIMPVVLNDCIPVPADAAPGSFAPGPAEIEARITERTSAILVAHIFGDPCDIEGIVKVAEKYNLPVVEDCAQAHMASIHGRKVGSFGTIGCFSIMFGKHFCAGGQGGLVFTRDEQLGLELKRSSDRGKAVGLPGRTNLYASLNCNMDEIHAVIGREQLKKLPEIVRRRSEGVKYLWNHGLEKLKGITCPQLTMPEGYESSYWRMRLEFHPENMTCDMFEYVKALGAEGVPCDSYHYACPFRQEWYVNRRNAFPWNSLEYKAFADQEYALPNIDKTFVSQFIVFLLESYGKEELDQIIAAFRKVDEAFAR